MPDEWSFSVAGQLSWVNLLYEILNEAIIFDGERPSLIISLLAIRLSLMINASSRVTVCGAAYMSVSLLNEIGRDSNSEIRIILYHHLIFRESFSGLLVMSKHI